MQLPIYNSVTMGMGWGLFLLVQTPQSAQRSHDRRVVIGANDMGWGNFSPTPFSLASIDCLHPSDKETEKKQSSIHCGVGLGRGVQKRKKENWGWMILCCLNLKLQLKLPIEGFFPPNNRRICVVIKYLMENYSQFFRQSMLNSTIFGEDSISLIALK